MRYKNNPGNIRYNSTLAGVVGNDNGFSQFSSLGYGLAAILTLLNTYFNVYGLRTISTIINRYAPPFENQTSNYIDFVSRNTKILPNQILEISDLIKIIPSIIKMETGTSMDLSSILHEIKNKSVNGFVYFGIFATFAAIGLVYYGFKKN